MGTRQKMGGWAWDWVCFKSRAVTPFRSGISKYIKSRMSKQRRKEAKITPEEALAELVAEAQEWGMYD